MKYIWAIKEDEYSDYRVVGVYSTLAKARVVAKYLGLGAPSKWPLDKGFDGINMGRRQFDVLMNVDDGNMTFCKPTMSVCRRLYSNKFILKSSDQKNVIDATVWARNAKHAVKIVAEYRKKGLAEGKL